MLPCHERRETDSIPGQRTVLTKPKKVFHLRIPYDVGSCYLTLTHWHQEDETQIRINCYSKSPHYGRVFCWHPDTDCALRALRLTFVLDRGGKVQWSVIRFSRCNLNASFLLYIPFLMKITTASHESNYGQPGVIYVYEDKIINIPYVTHRRVAKIHKVVWTDSLVQSHSTSARVFIWSSKLHFSIHSFSQLGRSFGLAKWLHLLDGTKQHIHLFQHLFF